MDSSAYADWFRAVTGYAAPHGWQLELGEAAACGNRLIRIPTGLGKTLGVGAAWYFHAVLRQSAAWPRRLVWCLPSRVLVEQTAQVLEQLVARAEQSGQPEFGQPESGQRDLGQPGGTPPVVVSTLLGGAAPRDWLLTPDQPAILVGTQDMLLSRALGRGYGSGRARWPLEYGLLNQDCLWVVDEVQLQGVGLATSIQLQAFRLADEAARRTLRPTATWWMSATLQPDWFSTVDFDPYLAPLVEQRLEVRPQARQGPLWQAGRPCTLAALPGKPAKTASQWADRVLAEHAAAPPATGGGRVTLVIVNRVDSAMAVHAALEQALKNRPDAPELQLVHSRFRARERRQWTTAFLSRTASEAADAHRIIVATQVVEAGVDVSATALVTELAPWPSLVQRFGRAARYGGQARVTVLDPRLTGKDALPYEEAPLEAAREALAQLHDVSLASLQQWEEQLRQNEPELLAHLYPFDYVHLLTRRECDELFDTSPDLSGADVDIGRFIREEEDRDVSVCWFRPGKESEDPKWVPPAELQPLRDALCPVPIGEARRWLLERQRSGAGPATAAWRWDYVESRWQAVRRAEQLVPGALLLVHADYGGYDQRLGFTGRPLRRGERLEVADGLASTASRASLADQGQLREDLSEAAVCKTIATHGREVAEEVSRLAAALQLPAELDRLLHIAARWHDWGKAHAVFQANIERNGEWDAQTDLAKATRWLDYRSSDYNWPERRGWGERAYGKRRGFRHELATMLGVLELLARAQPEHPGILGEVQSLLDPPAAADESLHRDPPPPPSPLLEELRSLSADEFDLLLYLLCSHHGKVRGALQATPHDQEFDERQPGVVGRGMPICGVRDGDPLPGVRVSDRDGEPIPVPEVTLHLDVAAIGLGSRYGRSWSERVSRLLDRLGPFTLALLEAVLRAADVAASQRTSEDPLLIREALR